MQEATANPFDEYISSEDFCSGLDITKRTEQRWQVLRIGPPQTVIGRKVFYHKKSLAEWMKQRECRSARSAP